jgi:MscS family membrane protein
MYFLDTLYFNNTLKAYLVVSGIIIFVLLFKRYLSRYLASLVYKIANRILKNINKQDFCDLVIEPIEWFVVIMVSVFSIDKLNFPIALNFSIYGHSSQDIITRIGPGIMIMAFTWLLLRLIDFIATVLEQKANQTDDAKDNQLIVFFRDFFKVLIAFIGILWIIKACFYQPIGNVLTGLSIVGAALALAAKESLENLIASFIIFFDKPFFTGDTVKVNAVIGTVEHIGLRSTRLRTADKTLVTIPNKQMVDSMVDNWSMRTARRAEIKLELHAHTTTLAIETLAAFIKQQLQLKNTFINSYEVFVKEINKNSITVSVEYFTEPIALKDFDALKETILLATLQFMEQQNIALTNGGAIL